MGWLVSSCVVFHTTSQSYSHGNLHEQYSGLYSENVRWQIHLNRHNYSPLHSIGTIKVEKPHWSNSGYTISSAQPNPSHQ